MISSLKIEAGKLVAWKVRNFLKELQFEGRNIEWQELKGIINNTFLIKGSGKDIADIDASIEEYNQ